MSRPFSAVLLAAGNSARMGRDKALLLVDSQPLWQRQLAVLRAAGAAEIILSARPEQAWAQAATGFSAVLADQVPQAGPLAGLSVALEHCTHAWLAVLAIDLPALTADWFHTLHADCAPGIGAVGRRHGYFEPLAAIYPREVGPLAQAALARGSYSLQPLLTAAAAAGRMRIREILPAEAFRFENWNTPRPPDDGPLPQA